VLGDADDAVGAADVLAHQGGVVAPDLRVREVGVLEEEEVVQGDDLPRALAGQQQRVRRVDEVQRRADHPVERRPLQPVPGQVQGVHREPAVHQRDVGRPRLLRVAVAQRGREIEEAVLGGEAGQPLGEGEDVGADARRPGQGGSQVEANTHRSRNHINAGSCVTFTGPPGTGKAATGGRSGGASTETP
jgi:transcriptional regulator of acetoin/glycerol metabolism